MAPYQGSPLVLAPGTAAQAPSGEVSAPRVRMVPAIEGAGIKGRWYPKVTEIQLKKAMQQAQERAPGNALMGVYHNAIYEKCLVKLIEYGAIPLQHSFEGMLAANAAKMEVLKEEEGRLRAALGAGQ